MNASSELKTNDSGPYYVALTLTVLWVVAAAYLLAQRWSEIDPLFSPAKDGRLPLNSIGDVLAGFFAPLAFLWLFVATTLQRRELKLQRVELADTREVLADQRKELETTARENATQTRIMNETLEATRATTVFAEFSLRLYYLAYYLTNEGIKATASVQSGDAGAPYTIAFFSAADNYRLTEEQASVDFAFHHLDRLIVGTMVGAGDVVATNRPEYAGQNESFSSVLNYVVGQLLQIENEYGSNSMARARMKGLALSIIRERLEFIRMKWRLQPPSS